MEEKCKLRKIIYENELRKTVKNLKKEEE